MAARLVLAAIFFGRIGHKRSPDLSFYDRKCTNGAGKVRYLPPAKVYPTHEL